MNLICFTSRRWTVLTGRYISTFEKEKTYAEPTEVIDILKIKTVKSDDNPLSFIFVRFKVNNVIYFSLFHL
jgi:hypothetical protein